MFWTEASPEDDADEAEDDEEEDEEDDEDEAAETEEEAERFVSDAPLLAEAEVSLASVKATRVVRMENVTRLELTNVDALRLLVRFV